MMYPLISIVMATYNGEKFLHEQMQSLIAQTYPNLEIIVSDDCSTDSTWQILNSYRQHLHIKISRNSANIGFMKNFEKMALQAGGEFVAFCDQDDVWLPEKVMELYNAIGNHSLVYSDSILIDETGNDMGKSLSDIRPLQNIYDVSSLALFNLVSGHSMLVKKETLQKALPIPTGIEYHDWYITIQAALQNGCVYLDKKLTLYRQHAHTCTKTICSKNNKSRALSVRYKHFIFKLKWITLIKHTCTTEQKTFFDRLYRLFSHNTNTFYNFRLFLFLLANQKTLYKFTYKNWLSRVIDIRKLARGEKAIEDVPEQQSFNLQFN